MNTYVDLNPLIGTEGQPPVLTGEAALKKALRNLFASHIRSRSRTFNQRWGCMLMSVLQEDIGEQTAAKIRAILVSTAATWDPRVTVVVSGVTVSVNKQGNGYECGVPFRENSTGFLHQFNLTLEV